MDSQIVYKYFPELSSVQKEQFAQLAPLYEHWNACINVISRKDIDQIYVRHVLHSLALSFIPNSFTDGSQILDIGTGGGFPGIPLAILYPNAHFTLCDSIGKKIKVVTQVCEALHLTNVTPITARAESLPKQSYRCIVSRAVTSLAQFLPWVHHRLTPDGKILFLKGGDLSAEIAQAASQFHIPAHLFKEHSIAEYFPELQDDFFATKKICEIKQTSYLCTPIYEGK